MVDSTGIKHLLIEYLTIRPLLMLIGIVDVVVDYFKNSQTMNSLHNNVVLSKLTDETNPGSGYR